MKLRLKQIFLVLAFSKSIFPQFIPDPSNAQLTLVTPSWLVWTTSKSLPKSDAADFGSTRIEIFIQSEPGQHGWKVYEHVVGMINNFSPVWVWKDGSVVSWGGWFNMAKENVLYEPDSADMFIATAEMPVLRAVGETGVVVMAPEEEVTMTSHHRLYYVPWAWDKRIVNYKKRKQMTDDEGIGYWSGNVLYGDNRFFASRTNRLFCYDISSGKIDSMNIQLIEKESSPIAFDGRHALIVSDTQCVYFDLKTRTEQKVYLPTDWQWIGFKGTSGFGLVTESDSARSTYKLVHREFLTGVEKILGQYSENPSEGEAHPPTAFIKGNTLWFWVKTQWLQFKL